jgi:hypothetical protein
MSTFIFRCPKTGFKVQGWSAEETPDDEPDNYETISCTACGQLHLVNRASGSVLGDRED